MPSMAFSAQLATEVTSLAAPLTVLHAASASELHDEHGGENLLEHAFLLFRHVLEREKRPNGSIALPVSFCRAVPTCG